MDGLTVASVRPSAVACTSASAGLLSATPVGASATKYGGTCPDATYGATGEFVTGVDRCACWATTTTMATTTTNTAIAAPAGASQPAQPPPRRVRAPASAGSRRGVMASRRPVSAAVRGVAEERSWIELI